MSPENCDDIGEAGREILGGFLGGTHVITTPFFPQGVVSGVLLITPQTLMFNPCVSDHLVIERGRDAYLIRKPLKAISRLIFFQDIAAMVTGDEQQQL